MKVHTTIMFTNGPCPAIRYNALNRLKDPLEACAMASGLNHELLSHLILNLNEYACLVFVPMENLMDTVRQ